jgi:hypothetical protein
MMPGEVTAADVAADRDWFATNPRRRYHARKALGGVWVVRKRSGGVFLRTWAAALPRHIPDTDDALRVQWFVAAWPMLEDSMRDELIRDARQAERASK